MAKDEEQQDQTQELEQVTGISGVVDEVAASQAREPGTPLDKQFRTDTESDITRGQSPVEAAASITAGNKSSSDKQNTDKSSSSKK